MVFERYLTHNLHSFDKQYSEGYGCVYPESHIIRFYVRVLTHGFGIDGSGRQRLLDFGCGRGAHALFFKSKGFDVYGVDIAESAINKCREIMPDIQDNFKIISPNPSSKSFFDVKYDVIVANQVLYYLSDSDFHKLLQSLYEQLKPGGVFFATMIGSSHHLYNYASIYHDGLYKVIPDKRLSGKSSYINFVHSDKELEEKFKCFKKEHVGYYDMILCNDEGSDYHYIYIGGK